MNFFQASRQGGKTQRLVRKVAMNKGSILFVHSEQYAEQLRREYPHILDRDNVKSWQHARETLRGRDRHAPVFVDNVDMFLQEMFYGRVVEATFSAPVIVGRDAGNYYYSKPTTS